MTQKSYRINPRVAIYSEKTLLSQKVVEVFNEKGISSKFVVGNKSLTDVGEISGFNYLIFIIDPEEHRDSLNSVYKIISNFSGKSLLVFCDGVPLRQNKIIKKLLKDKKTYSGVLVVPKVFPKDDTSNENSKTIQINSRGYEQYFISPEHAADAIYRYLFSLKAYGAKTKIQTKPVGKGDIQALIKDKYPTWKLSEQKTVYSKIINIYKDNEDSLEVLERGIDQLEYQNQSRKLIPKPEVKSTTLIENEKKTSKDKPRKRLKGRLHKNILLGLFALVFFPVAFFLLGLLFLATSTKALYMGDLGVSKVLADSARAFVVPSNFVFKAGATVPGAEILYTPLANTSESAVVLSDINLKSINAAGELTTLVNGLLGNKDFDAFNQGQKSSLALNELYKNIQFYEASRAQSSNFENFISGLVVNKSRLEKLSETSIYVRDLVTGFTNYIKEKDKTRWLVVVQDEDVARPTGGIITSLATITLDNGNISEVKTYHPSEIDSKLTGLDIENSSSYFRDANSDPDFPTTAAQLEWFVNKATGDVFDGVVSVNAKSLEKISKIVGIKLVNDDNGILLTDDYPEVATGVSQKNLDSFFSTLKGIPDKHSFLATGEIVKALYAKDIQIFFNDEKVNRLLSDSNWNGEVVRPTCNEPCFSDILLIVENSKTEGSQNIDREGSLNISFEEGVVKREALIFLENKNDEDYHTQVSVFAPSDVGFGQVIISDNRREEILTPDVLGKRDLKEALVDVTIPKNSAIVLKYFWESNLPDQLRNSYAIKLGKQSGIESFPVSVKISGVGDYDSESAFSLTEGGELIYNTLLAEDKSLRLFNLR